MRRLFLPLFAFLLCLGGFVAANAQPNRSQSREIEWKNYALPQTNFTRKIDADKTLIFRVPADWQQDANELTFKSPEHALLKVLIQKIPEGYPLDDYFAATLQTVRDLSGGAESVVTRKTQVQNVAAREMVVEAPNPEGELIRSTTWIAIHGPNAIVFTIKAPAIHAAEFEPYFKAIVQSVIFTGYDYESFEKLRDAAIKSPAPAPLSEIENIVESLSETSAQREAAITRLAAQFSANADVALDLLLDQRPMVRVGAVQAAAQSRNSLLTPFLWQLLNDNEPLVSEAAARSVANATDVVANTLEHSMGGFRTETIARIWPFLAREKRNELLEIVFKETARPASPPPAKAPSKVGNSAKAVEAPPVRRGVSVSGLLSGSIQSLAAHDANVQIGMLTLLAGVPPEDYKLPLARIMASNYDPLIAVGLQVATFRGEALPVATLLKLVASSNKQVSLLAAQSLGVASVTDVPLIEALISKNGLRKEVADELKVSVRKIKFRDALAAAKTEAEKRALIDKTVADTELADFAWLHDCEANVAGCGNATMPGPKANVAIKPLAENLFPKQVRHYTAIPNPRQTVQKFYETLRGLQLDTPRAQASLVLMMTQIRSLLAQSLSAPDTGELLDYTGIDPDAPIVFVSWTAQNAPDSMEIAQRKAIVLRVQDRGRFERTIEDVQRRAGIGLTRLTDYVGVGSRAFAAYPALLPLSAQAAISPTPAKPAQFSLLRYSFIGDKEWNGLKLRVLQNSIISSAWKVQGDTTYVAYLGDNAILTPDLGTLRDLLVRANSSGGAQSLADNSEFRQTVANGGDVIYFSDLKAVFAEPGKPSWSEQINERGALKFSESAWENSHHVTFEENEWAKPLLPFHPKDLTAARELLPASTIGYYLMKLDLPALWSNSAKSLFTQSESEALPKLWVPNFEKEVLPELGPECGAVLTELPSFVSEDRGSWAAFCKLKTAKLSDALVNGKLLLGVGPTTDVAEVKFGSDSYFLAARRGFLVIANRAKALADFDGKTNLAATRDYSRSVEKVPPDVIAFGGYNLEAAVTGVTKGVTEGRAAEISRLLFSVASAFHSQNFYATVTPAGVEAHSSVSMDREGRYPVADFSSSRGLGITFALVEPHGVPITDQNRLSSVVLRVQAKVPGPIENIKDDIKSADQTVEQNSATELRLTVAARRTGAEQAIQLPVKDPQFAEFLKATPEFAADKKEVIDKAREIAGKDRDAWSVARKLSDWTNKNLEWKRVVYADPVQTLATREADCSEFSALFVAMARSLGLPARMVSGLAYSGNSFGGHAWVEVWAGRWIELDPTFGTSFVDATHIRDTNNTLLTSVALNLIELEVLEARHTTAEFQKTPRALAEHLMKAIPSGDRSGLEAAIDLPVVTDEQMGAGSWANLNNAERDLMWSAYRRVVTEVLGYGDDGAGARRFRLVHLEEKGDVAEVVCMTSPIELLLKLRLVRRGDVWYLAEVVSVDSYIATLAELMQPAITSIKSTRAGEKSPSLGMTDLVRVLLLFDKDAAKALSLTDELLKAKPKDTGFRFYKALALLAVDKEDDGIKLLTELSDENFPPAVYKLAEYFNESEDAAETEKAIPLFERYIKLEPHDPRGFRDLASAYDDANRSEQAEAAYRKAIEIDPTEKFNYRSLIEILIMHDKLADARAVLVAGDKHLETNEDLFGSVMEDFCYARESKGADRWALSEPARMKASARANLALGRLLAQDGRYAEAARLLNTAVQLDKKSADPYIAMAMLNRKQSQWSAALKAADQAIALDAKDSEAHYQRACALARLRRLKEAMAAIAKAVELDPVQATYLSDEEDLKPLSSLPEFRKLLPPPEKPQP